MLTFILNIALSLIFTGNNYSFEKDLKNYLAARLSERGRYEYEILRAPSVDANESIMIDKSSELKVTSGIAYVPVFLKKSNGVSTKSYATIRLRLYSQTLQARYQISRGESVNPRDFDIVEVDVTGLRSRAIDPNENLDDVIARITIRAGEILTDGHLERKPIIQRGDPTLAYIKRGNVLIRIDAVAREDGAIGEKIRIVGSNNKIFRAEVIDSETVKIIE